MRLLYLGPPDLSEHVQALLAQYEVVSAVDDESIDALIPDCEVVLDASMKHSFSAERLSRASRLRLFVAASTGADHIDAPALRDRSIPLITMMGEPRLYDLAPAAEHAWLLLLACARQITAAAEAVLEGQWERTRFPGIMLQGKTLGIVGCGRLGQRVARYGAAFRMRCIGHDPHVKPWPPDIERTDLGSLLRSSDFVTVHVPLTDETRHMLGANELQMVKHGAILINTSRGGVVDDAALESALSKGTLAGAGLDVLSTEPDIKGDPLVELARHNPRIIITPHIGGFSPEALREVLSICCERIAAVESTHG